MKNFTITMFLLALACGLQAQVAKHSETPPPSKETLSLPGARLATQTPLKGGGDIFWKEEFDWSDPNSQIGWLLPTSWKMEDPDDLGYNWHWATDTLKGVYTNEPPIKSDSRANGFLALNLDGYNKDLGNYNNYLSVNSSIVSPSIDCSAHSSVLVKLAQNFRYWSEADMLFEVTNDKGAHWASYDMKMGTLYSERVGGIAAGDKVDLYLNLTDVAAGMPDVQFKITWRKARLYYWMIDDITFMEGWENDLQMLYYEANYDNGTTDKEGFFYSLPKTQLSGYNMMAVIRNFGNGEQWDTHLKVEVVRNSQPIYSQTTVPYNFYPGLTDTFRIAQQFVPEEFGHYRMDFSANMDNEDELPGDNFASIPFHVTDSVFSRCDNQPEVSFSTWGWYTYQHEGDLMGTWYPIKKDMEINSISAYISYADIRSTFRFVLLGYNAEEDATYELLGSDFMQMDSTILKNHWVTLPLIKDGEGEFLTAGNSYMVCVEFFNNLDFQAAYDSKRYGIGSDRNNFYPSGKCWFYQTEVLAWWSSSNDLFMIRMNLNDQTNLVDGIDNQQLSGTLLMQNYPNPFSNETTISYKLDQSSDIELKICDITGRVVRNQKMMNMPAGEHSVLLNGADFQPGTYLYTLTGNNFTKTMRLTVSR
ncbi:MAG: T9SS type A sorting domain-containing protein [Bacteroidales bacterium]